MQNLSLQPARFLQTHELSFLGRFFSFKVFLLARFPSFSKVFLLVNFSSVQGLSYIEGFSFLEIISSFNFFFFLGRSPSLPKRFLIARFYFLVRFSFFEIFSPPKVYPPCKVFLLARFSSLKVSLFSRLFLLATFPPCGFLPHKVFLHARFPLLMRFSAGIWEQKWGGHPQKTTLPPWGSSSPLRAPSPRPGGAIIPGSSTREFEGPLCFSAQPAWSQRGWVLFDFISPAP